ncbi:MAG: heavy metal translocating P-type ATPase [Rhodocyclaceae bacterium]|nr:heavy metal translocating P-type ATPase [Rhodocyclaceae bacterium]
MTEHSCYHCGLPVPNAVHLDVEILGEPRPMCCAGCEAVARSIVDSGLSDYYRHRDSMPESRREALPDELVDLGLFDSHDFQASFVRVPEPNQREATLLLEGITCAACVWLNEQHVAHQPGVIAVSINYATRRARVRWNDQETRLSRILASIQAIGYRAYPYDPQREETLAGKERKSALWRLFVAGFGAMQVMMYALPEYVAGEGEMSADMSALLRWASLVLTLPVVLYSAGPFFSQAWRDLRQRRLGMDVPVSLGIGTAFLASLWSFFSGQGEVYFDSVAMFVFFLLCGRFLEMLARQKAARGAEELAKILPAVAERLTRWPGVVGEQVDVSRLAVGDVVRIKPGTVIPADGVVLDGSSAADESLLTGESVAVEKAVGDSVIGGSVNGASPLVVRLTGVGDSTRLAGIRRLMDRAQDERPRAARLADRFAGRFVALVVTAAALTGLFWWGQDPDRALWVCVSVLVVSCPCALSLATPVALTVATASLARQGVLVTRGHALESLAAADFFVFDKTGTLTTGAMKVESMEVRKSRDLAWVQSVALGLEVASEHRIAEALRSADWPVTAASIEQVSVHVGEGVSGRYEGLDLRLGNAQFVSNWVPESELARIADGLLPKTPLFLACPQGLLASFGLSDEVRDDAAELVAALRVRGAGVGILSGDTQRVVEEVAERIGVSEAAGGQMPEDKLARVKALQLAGRRVAMIGDGVNDGPVLARADVSVAMGEGTELARNQADVVLLGGRFLPLLEGLRTTTKCNRVIRQNLVWALTYNLIAMPAAMAGWVTPWMAGIGMSASSLVVILNALRIQRRV